MSSTPIVAVVRKVKIPPVDSKVRVELVTKGVMIEVLKVGEVLKTSRPEPVSSVTEAARLAELIEVVSVPPAVVVTNLSAVNPEKVIVPEEVRSVNVAAPALVILVVPANCKAPSTMRSDLVVILPVVVKFPFLSIFKVPVPTVKPSLAKTGALNSEVAATVNLSEAVEPIEADPPTPKEPTPAEPETPREAN
ncbi:MAG: hypothetical protein DDT18_01467 [Actinobacteria bacterium]|nr:hypothetical protein [Actinomycetota bacterium]